MAEVFGILFDENKNLPTEISDSNIWFSLDHPKVQYDMGLAVEFYFPWKL